MIDGAHVVCYATIAAGSWEGRTQHITGGEEIDDPAGLAICRYEVENEFYLFYCTTEWEAMTDTYHESIAGAKTQAEFEGGQSINFIDTAV